MKPKNIVLAALFLIVAGLGVWYFTKLAPPLAKAPAPGLNPGAPKNVIPGVAPSSLSAPSGLRPGPASLAATLPIAVPLTNIDADPQADLKTAIPDIARLIRAGDLIAFYEKYTPPDKFDPQQIQRIQAQQRQNASNAPHNLQMQNFLQAIKDGAAQAYDAIEFQTPTYNDAGNEATYLFTLPTLDGKPGKQISRIFVKIDDKWYLKE
jgi:hypothetical protein